MNYSFIFSQMYKNQMCFIWSWSALQKRHKQQMVVFTHIVKYAPKTEGDNWVPVNFGTRYKHEWLLHEYYRQSTQVTMFCHWVPVKFANTHKN